VEGVVHQTICVGCGHLVDPIRRVKWLWSHEDSTQVTGGGQGNKRRGVAECKRQWRDLVDVSCDIVW
jgi:hypothetical protein